MLRCQCEEEWLDACLVFLDVIRQCLTVKSRMLIVRGLDPRMCSGYDNCFASLRYACLFDEEIRMPQHELVHKGYKFHICTEQLQNGCWICMVYRDPPYFGSGCLVEAPPTVGDPKGDEYPRPEKPGGPFLFATEDEAHGVGIQHAIAMLPPALRG